MKTVISENELKSETQIKPCAHCGNEKIEINIAPYFTDSKRVMCYKCGIMTLYMPDEESIEVWNKRI